MKRNTRGRLILMMSALLKDASEILVAFQRLIVIMEAPVKDANEILVSFQSMSVPKRRRKQTANLKPVMSTLPRENSEILLSFLLKRHSAGKIFAWMSSR